MRQRQSSVTTDTQYPVRSIGATAFGLGGGTAARWPPRCAFANVGSSSNEAIRNAMESIGWTDTPADRACQAIPELELRDGGRIRGRGKLSNVRQFSSSP